jgi:hypothetical protein
MDSNDLFYYLFNVSSWIVIFKFKLYRRDLVRAIMMPWFAIGRISGYSDEVAFCKILGVLSIGVHSIYIIILFLTNPLPN